MKDTWLEELLQNLSMRGNISRSSLAYVSRASAVTADLKSADVFKAVSAAWAFAYCDRLDIKADRCARDVDPWCGDRGTVTHVDVKAFALEVREFHVARARGARLVPPRPQGRKLANQLRKDATQLGAEVLRRGMADIILGLTWTGHSDPDALWRAATAFGAQARRVSGKSWEYAEYVTLLNITSDCVEGLANSKEEVA